MPFITQEQRLKLENGGKPEVVGDLCYLAYKEMVRRWKENPRWTTAHNIFRNGHTFYPEKADCTRFTSADYPAAIELAWQVFFQNYVMPYERKKEKQNGTI